MIISDIVQQMPTWPVVQELAFLKQQTGQDEATLFGSALLLGINLLYRQTVEQAFIEGKMPREEALKILGHERLAEIEYAQRALTEDINQAWGE